MSSDDPNEEWRYRIYNELTRADGDCFYYFSNAILHALYLSIKEPRQPVGVCGTDYYPIIIFVNGAMAFDFRLTASRGATSE